MPSSLDLPVRLDSVGQAVFAVSVVSTVSIVVFIAFTAALLHRKYRGSNALPRWTILCCLLGWLVYFVFLVISTISSINVDYFLSESMQTGTLPVIFSLFQWMPICLSFYVFYTFIHLLLGKTTQSAKPWHRTRVFHWVCFIIVVLVACLCFSFNCALNLRKGPAADSPILTAALPIEFATQIAAWMASAENWGWSIFLAVRHPRCVGGHILPTLFLLLATTFWCAALFLLAIYKILWYISVRDEIMWTGNTITLYSGLSFVGLAIWGTLGSIIILVYWVGILLFCFRWAKLHSKSDWDAQLQTPELPVDSESGGTTYHEIDDQPHVAELPGDYNQLFEAENTQLFEAHSPEKDKLSNAQHSDLREGKHIS